ncbi:hypothetical protein D9R13_23365, partial [Mycobacteroides abscessus subsp. massiliense]
ITRRTAQARASGLKRSTPAATNESRTCLSSRHSQDITWTMVGVIRIRSEYKKLQMVLVLEKLVLIKM